MSLCPGRAALGTARFWRPSLEEIIVLDIEHAYFETRKPELLRSASGAIICVIPTMPHRKLMATRPNCEKDNDSVLWRS
jgi:hypothetical protein